MTKIHATLTAFALALGVSLVGCDSVDTTDNPPVASSPVPAVPVTVPRFNPALAQAGDITQIPVPNDLLRNPQTGFIQVPASLQGDPYDSLRSLRGFSTAANIIIPFTGGIVPSSVDNESIRVLDAATNATVSCTFSVQNPLLPGQTTNSVVQCQPVLPLKPAHTYVVEVTSALQGSNGPVQPTPLINLLKNTSPLVDSNGHSTVSGVPDADALALEPVRVFYQPIWARVGTSVPFAFQFGTQPLFATLPALQRVAVQDNHGFSGAAILADSTVLAPSPPYPAGTSQVDAIFSSPTVPAGIQHNNIGRIIIGSIVAPNYIGDPLTGFFSGTGLPGDPVLKKSDRTIPFIGFLPKGAGPFKPLMYQHGFTSNKMDAGAIANSANGQGFGVIAIDLVLHGDLALNPGNSTTSGAGFFNSASLRTTRDNLRQSAVNLFYIDQAIVSGQTAVTGLSGNAFTSTHPVFVGHSLGSFVGVDFLATEPDVKYADLSGVGARFTTQLLASPSFHDTFVAGLVNQGAPAGSESFNLAVQTIQTVLDDADPFNYAATLAAGSLRAGDVPQILVQEMMADTVVPESSTLDLANAMNITQVAPVVDRFPLLPVVNSPVSGISGLFQFPGARHSALLLPSEGDTANIQAQAFTFLASGVQSGMAVIFNALPRVLVAPVTGPVPVPDYNQLFYPRR